MNRGLNVPVVITPPVGLPVTLDAVKNFARITTTADDDLITGFIAAATEQAQLFTGRSFLTQTLKLTLDHFPRCFAQTPWWSGVVQGPISFLQGYPDPVVLPSNPLQSVVSIVTYDQYGNSTTIDPTTYRVDTVAGRILLTEGNTWPSELRNMDAIEITYVAGYGDTAASVPASICSAIMMSAQKMVDSRTVCDLCDGSKALLGMYKVPRI